MKKPEALLCMDFWAEFLKFNTLVNTVFPFTVASLVGSRSSESLRGWTRKAAWSGNVPGAHPTQKAEAELAALRRTSARAHRLP